jgi:hypothetical protein
MRALGPVPRRAVDRTVLELAGGRLWRALHGSGSTGSDTTNEAC